MPEKPIPLRTAAKETGTAVETAQSLRQRRLRWDRGRFAKEPEAHPPPLPRRREACPDRHNWCGIVLSKAEMIWSLMSSSKSSVDWSGYPISADQRQGLRHHWRIAGYFALAKGREQGFTDTVKQLSA